MPTEQQSPVADGLYPISAVSSLTGVNAVTLRAWERRYGLVRPHRTEGGRRLYSRDEIEMIRRVLRLLDQGVAISRVADAMRQAGASPDSSGPWRDYRAQLVAGIGAFSEAQLEKTYDEALSLYPVDVVTRQLLLPLLRDLGERWESGDGSVAEEHFFSVYLRNKLGARFHHLNLRSDGPRLVAACLPGEQHEFGLLMFALAAHARGYRLILLGANMPLAGLEPVVTRTASRAVVLSGAASANSAPVLAQLAELAAGLAVPVLVGGTFAVQNAAELEAAGVRPLGDDLTAGMDELVRLVPPSRKSTAFTKQGVEP